MNIYLCVIHASLDGTVHMRPLLFAEENSLKAVQKCMDYAFKLYPVSEGYHSHDAQADILPESYVQRILVENCALGDENDNLDIDVWGNI